MLTKRKHFADSRILFVMLLLGIGTYLSAAQSFAFPSLRLAATNGLINRVFTSGERIVPEVSLPQDVWYRVTVRDGSGMVMNPSVQCTPSALWQSTDNSYTIQPTDAPTTAGPGQFIIETFLADACDGPPLNSATQQFYIVSAAAFTSPSLTAATNRFTTAQTAHLRVVGMPAPTTNWNVVWIVPNGSTSCVNTVGSDRPDVGNDGILSSSHLAYPPSNTFPDAWNRATNYSNDGSSCQGFSTASEGAWQVHLFRNASNFVTLPAFTLSNDCVAVTINPPLRVSCEGTAAAFTAVTNGTGPFTLVWRKDGEVIAGVTGSTLTIPNASTATAGVYSVESTGPCGTATNYATLVVAVPQVPQALPNQTVCSNDTVIFIAPTNGPGPFSFQWRRSNTPIAGATNQVLILPSVTAASAGDYRVVVTNTCNVVTNIGSLTVNPGLTLSPLTNLVRYVGTFAGFSTTPSSGAGPVTYSWRKDGLLLTGQTNRSLSLSNLTVGDSGTYTVTAVRANNCDATVATTLIVAYCFNSLDVMLVIDRSASMLGESNKGVPYRDARTAATNFVRNLILGTNADVVGLASYNASSTLNHPLSSSAASVETAISSLPAATGGTCISCGLNTAQEELTSVRHRVGALPVMLLLTDGIPKTNDSDSISLVLSNAYQSKLAGTRVFTLGLNDGTGTNVDQVLMANLASSSNDFFYANDSSQLPGIFDQIAAILCRGPNRIEGPTPSNAVICAGDTLQFDVTATGCALFTFEWRHNGVVLAGQTNPSLVRANATEADSGQYSVVISSFCGTITNSAALLVHPKTSLIGPPSQTVCAGANVNFTAYATGASLTYQWWRGTVPILGQTNATLLLTNVSSSDQDYYAIQVRGVCGELLATNTSLTVWTRPALPGLTNVFVCPGEPVILHATTNGTGPLNIVWRREGLAIPGANSPTLELGPADMFTTGTYSVEVAGPCGRSTNSALVMVLTNTVATPLVSQTRCVGETTQFNTAVEGTGPFTFVWRHEGNILSEATNSSLLLFGLTTNHAGLYTVEVTGTCGTVLHEAQLTVLELTTASPLTNLVRCAGEPASFNTTILGAGPWQIVWRKDGVVLPDETNSTISWASVTTNEAGLYSVEVSGACNSITNAALLTVNELLTATPLADASICEGRAVMFQTTPGGTGPFTFVWRHGTSIISGATNASLVLSNLTASETGLYSVEVTGICGRLTNSAQLTVLEITTATPLANLVRCAGEPASFNTTILGAGPWQIVWRKDGVVLPHETNSTLSWASVTTNEAGLYSVEISGACNAVTNAALLTVNELLTATPFADASICAGEAVTFQTTPGGTGPFTFVWRHGTSIISGATNASLVLSNLTASEAGLYSVEVGGICGRLTNSAQLTVLELTTATLLVDAEVCVGGEASFTTVASGAGPFSYVWRRDGLLLEGATNATLPLTNLSSANAGLYTVEVAGVCHAVTNSAALTVLALTTATPFPDVTRCDGDTVTFSTTASGSAPLNYQWRHAGVLMEGETNSTLTLLGLTATNAGSYAVEVSGACGAVTNRATLTVLPMTVALPLTDATICENDNISFITFASGAGPFSFVWRHRGVVVSGATNSTFTITNAGVADAGPYSVEVTGACNAVTNSATLVVRLQTRATAPENMTLCEGGEWRPTTLVSGTGPFDIVWRRGEVALAGQTNDSILLSLLTTNDAGIYSVEVTGACNSVTNSFMLTVETLTTVAPLANLVQCRGTVATFHAQAGGTGPFTYAWWHDGALLTDATNAMLTLTNVSVATAGLYNVTVEGRCGSVTRAARLDVLELISATPFVDLVRCAGEPASFNTTILGAGPWQIVWRKDGVVLPDETNSTISWASVTTNEAGLYSVEISNPCNSVTNAALLTVNELLTATPFADASICAGETVTFQTTPGGTGPFTFVWRHGASIISGATNASLVLSNLTASDAGLYSVEVGGICGRLTNSAQLTVLEITTATPLANLVRCVGEPASFSTTILGAGPWQIVWRKDGVVLPHETNSTLSWASVTTNEAGLYSVEISGACNAVTNAALLTVNERLTAASLADASVCRGGQITFRTMPGGTGPFTFVWRHGASIISGATNARLTLTNLMPTDAGLYTVEVTGICGRLTNSAQLTVLELTTATPLADLVRCAGEPASFSTTILGAGPWQIVWRKDGVVLPQETNSALSWASVTTNEAGLYSVEISGACNAVTNAALLTVNELLTATPLADASICAGRAVTFQTTPGGTGPFTFVWRHGASIISGATNASLVLSNLTASEAGLYSVEVGGICGRLTNSAHLTVLELTTATPLADLVRCVGEPASFNTTILGAGPWQTVWRKDGVVLPHETNSILSWASVSTNEAGLYSVEVSGACNSITNAALLTVNELTASSPLADVTVCAGQPINLSVQVRGTGPHAYFWRRNGQLIDTTPGVLIGSASPADNGVYSVEVIGVCNRVTNFATVTVREITVVAPLTGAVRCAGGSVTFEALTTGTGPFSYVWLREGSQLPGQTNALLSLNHLATNDAGLYSVQVSGACNLVVRSATLVVNETVLATPLTNQVRCVGESVSFSPVISGSGPLTIQWRKAGQALPNETNATLSFVVASTNDAGLYSVEVAGACGALTNTATLAVRAPVISNPVADQFVWEGRQAVLDSGLNGGDEVTFLWRKNGVLLPTATNDTLTLTNLSLADSGVHEVEIVTPCGRMTNTMTLTVVALPLALVNQARCVGDTGFFQATASTDLPFTFTWRRDGALLADETNSSLVLTALTTNAGGVYSVEVAGVCGSVTNSATLAILQPPSIAPLPNQAQCAGANVTFTAVVSGSGPIEFCWRKEGVLLPGETNFSLSFTNVTLADAALYSVEAMGACATATNAVQLTVSTVPVIAALTNLPVCLGQNAVLAPAISGVGHFSKVWRKDGVVLIGETNATLFFGAVSNAHAGLYTLEVSGACGRATNHTLLTPRTNAVVAALGDRTVCAGGGVTFQANVLGTGPFAFVWKKNGVVISEQTSSALTLTNLVPSDSALYTVEATTFCNTASASSLLTVDSSLTATPLANLTLCAGQTAIFGTTASGGPQFTYQWRKNGATLAKQTNATLVLANLHATNAGLYSVEVAGCGRATNSAQLTVTPLVAATLPPVITACNCDDLTITPNITVAGNYTYLWRKNGTVLPGETNAGIYMPMLNMHSAGQYSVEISGPCNSLTLQTTLEVLSPTTGRWTNNDGSITIRDFEVAAPYPSTNMVRCAPKAITQLRVTVFGLTHGFPDDIDIALVAPNGQGIKLMSDNGGSGGNALSNVTLVFDDAAPGFLSNGGFIPSGTYRPTDISEGLALPDIFQAPGPGAGFVFATNFAQFYGSNPNGAWKLFVVDDHGGQLGSLQRWVLDFGRIETVIPNLRLTAPVQQPGGGFQMELKGEPGKGYFLEASTNLVHWTIIQTNHLNASSMTLTDLTAPQFNYRFYRVSGCR